MTDQIARRRDMLARTPMFGKVPPSHLDSLAGKAKTLTLKAREMLFAKGDPGDRLFVVDKGLIRIGVLSPDGREVTYGLIKPGQLFGEIAVLDGGPRTADASAMEATELLVLERKDVLAFLAEHPSHSLRLIEILCERVRRADELLEDIFFLTLPGRLAKHLLVLGNALGERDGPDGKITIKMSQQEVADHMGITRESVNKVLSKWEQAGLVGLWRGRITLHDTDALEDFIAID
ncbi:MAG: Crp/Fnr family transcriptional regulator [Actinomycetota bacterium]